MKHVTTLLAFGYVFQAVESGRNPPLRFAGRALHDGLYRSRNVRLIARRQRSIFELGPSRRLFR
jgi:hypothetical protein